MSEVRYFSALVVKVLGFIVPDKYQKWIMLYVENRRFLNYCFVCGVLGVGVNMLILYSLVNIFPLWLANGCAIMGAMVNNYYLTVGPGAYLFEFTEEKK